MAAKRACRFPGLFLGLGAVLFLLLPMQAGAVKDDGGLTGTIEVYRVVDAEGGGEKLLPAEEAHPKDIIEYRLVYKNNGGTPLKNISITDPVPEGTVYISKSAKKPQMGIVLFSIDGGSSYHHWPIRILTKTAEGKEEWKEAKPEMVTHIRWTIDDAIDPEQEIIVSYRAYVE
ncbi:MAG: DUF11 domain-containing protein [Candidatus Latescibacteria bacterium]|nr:DUF11 domain-containing protein [Candidatus Latescibacterota bacterium]NIM64532.1 DUF11 domain-containing protein [Candidatus Latescibacterota bacterium]NIO00685.1 DUF11 domain-containing protein [Candidatus Latescibacterota bacterium]NIO27088.1 DUF11 domain-containing protein [Candidatus Latescibacterota bacterium]NIO54612.1 DUF11 domain-containing protein [Candidatus Latescibacterota bacterium]